MSGKRKGGRSLRLIGVVTVVVVLGAGPAMVPEALAQGAQLGGSGRFINAEMIRLSGAQTIWEALQRLAPQLTLQENASGTPARILNRGVSTVALREGPLVYVDNIRLADFRTLGTMPAGDVASIQIMSGIDGTTRYGLGAVSGVILIRTKVPPKPVR